MKATKTRGSSPIKLMLIDLVDSPPEMASTSSVSDRGSLTKRKKETFVDDEEDDGSNSKYSSSELHEEESSDGT